jgi:hypothetical protein
MHESLFFYIELNWRLLENARKKIYRSAAFPLFSCRRIMEKLCFNIRVLKFKFMFEIFMYFIYSATLAYNREKSNKYTAETEELIHSFNQSINQSIIHPLFHFFFPPIPHSFIHSLTYLLIFINSVSQSVIHSITQSISQNPSRRFLCDRPFNN